MREGKASRPAMGTAFWKAVESRQPYDAADCYAIDCLSGVEYTVLL